MKSFLCFLSFGLLLTGCAKKPYYLEGALIIDKVTLIDPIDGAMENQTVIISHGKIFKIVPSETIILDQRNQILDGTGKYLMPGLWDAHVHFAYLEALAPSMFDLFLRFGVTSVRDTGGKLAFVSKYRKMSLERPTKAPRLMIAGPLLDGSPNVYDGSSPRLPPLSIKADDVAHIAKNVETLLQEKVDFLKAYEMLSPEQLGKIIELADANHLKVTGHIPLSMDAVSASNAGMDSFEHLRNLEISCASNAKELRAERRELLQSGQLKQGGELRAQIHQKQQEIAIANYDDGRADSVLVVLKANDTWQIPTLALNTLFTEQYFADATYQKSYDLLPDSLATYWTARSHALKEYPITAFRSAYDAWNFMMVKKIRDAEIPIMAGTDTPIAFLTPGLSLHVELATLVKAGLTPIEALKSATVKPAAYFDLDGELGRVKSGFWADLVLLTDNPLDNIANTKNIAAVIKQGEIYTPQPN